MQTLAPPLLDTATRSTAAPARRRRLIWGVLAGVLILGSGSVWAYSNGYFNWFDSVANSSAVYTVTPVDLSIILSEDGELKPRESVELRCELEGQNTLLSIVPESTAVKKGDLVVELASDTIKERLETEKIELRKIEAGVAAAEQEFEITKNQNASEIKKAEIDLEVAQLELTKYRDGEYVNALTTAEMDIRQARMDIERKEDELNKNRPLLERGFVTRSKIEQLEFDLEKARDTLKKAELAKVILETYDRPKNMTEKSSAVEQATQELERTRKRAESKEKQAEAALIEQRSLLAMRTERVGRLQVQFEKCKILAPADGIVQYPNDGGYRWGGGNRIAAGEKVYEGQTLIVLPDTSQMIVETRIHEADRHKVKEGMTCLVSVPAVPHRQFRGRIDKIARFADSANRWLNPELKEHTTEILLDETDGPLSPGESAEIKVLVEDVKQALAVPVQCVFSRGSDSYVFRASGAGFQPQKVKLGRSTATMIEISEGVSAGDRILREARDELIALLPAPKDDAAEMNPEEAPKPRGGGGEGGGRRGGGGGGGGGKHG